MLLSFDFDGTLVHPPEILEPPRQFFEALDYWRERGAIWVVNTGRSLEHVLEGLHEARLLEPGPDYLLLREQEIWEPDGEGGWRDSDGWNARRDELLPAWLEQHRELFAEIRQRWEEVDRGAWIEDLGDPAGLMGWDEAAIEAFVPRLEAFRKDHPGVTWQRNGVWLRFVMAGYDKGVILTELARKLGIERERIFAVGDGFNDLEMLHPEVAGCFACPSNGQPEVRERVARRGGWLLDRPASYGATLALEQLREVWS